MTVYLEESIMQEGLAATAGSGLLEGFIAPFSATVVERLLEKGHEIAGRFSLCEFGLPDLLNGAPPTKTPIPAPLLCNDIFGLYRKYAAENNLCYIRPAYGTVSRYGLIPAAASMDQIGILCKNPEEGLVLLADFAGYDEKDGAMHPEGSPAYNFPEIDLGQKAQAPTDLPHFELYAHVLYILACGEISHNLSRYDGVKFGRRAAEYSGLEDLYTNTRAGFGDDAKLTAIMGAMLLSENFYDKYYDKALRMRRVISDALNALDGGFVLPGAPGGDSYSELSLAAPAMLAGWASVTFEGAQFAAAPHLP